MIVALMASSLLLGGNPSPFKLTITPPVLAANVRVVKITNAGTKSVRLRTEITHVGSVNNSCHVTSAAISWGRVRPGIIYLRPGESRNAKFALDLKKAPKGKQDLAVLFTTIPQNGQTVTVRASVGSQIKVIGEGPTQKNSKSIPCSEKMPKKSAPQSQKLVDVKQGIPIWQYGVAAAIIVILLSIIVAMMVRRRYYQNRYR